MSVIPQEIIKQVLNAIDPVQLIQLIGYRVDTIQDFGDRIKCFCPIHRESVFRTLIIDKVKKQYKCSYSLCKGYQGGDLIDLVARSREKEYYESLNIIAKELHLNVEIPETKEYVNKMIEVGKNYLELGEIDDAEKSFRSVLELQPSNIEAHRGLIEVYSLREDKERLYTIRENLVDICMDSHRYQDASILLNSLIAENSDSISNHEKLADCYEHLNKPEDALAEYMNAASLHENNHNFPEALEIYKKIEALNVDIIDIYPHIIQTMMASDRRDDAFRTAIQHAEEFVQKNNFESALECYGQALEINPMDKESIHQYVATSLRIELSDAQVQHCINYIEPLLAAEEYEDVERLLSDIHASLPQNESVIKKLAEVYRAQKREDEEHKILTELVNKYRESGRLPEALSLLDELLQTTPESLELLGLAASIAKEKGDQERTLSCYRTIARIYEKQNRKEDATSIYESILEINANDITALSVHTEHLLEKGQHPEALECISRLIDSMVEQEQYDDVEQWCQKALSLNPSDIQLQLKLGEVLLTLSKKETAKPVLIKAASLLLESDAADQAIEPLNKVLEHFPADVDAQMLLANAYTTLGKNDEAAAALKSIAEQHIQEHRDEMAESILAELLKLRPDDSFALEQYLIVTKQIGDNSKIATAYLKCAESYAQQNNPSKAIEQLTHVLEIDPHHIPALHLLIDIYKGTNKTSSVIDLYLKLGDIYGTQGNMVKQKESFEALLAIDERHDKTHQLLLRVLLEQKGFEQANTHASKLIDRYVEEKRFQDAIAVQRLIMEYQPDVLAHHEKLVWIIERSNLKNDLINEVVELIKRLEKSGEDDKVLIRHTQLVALSPENVEFHRDLINLLKEKEKINEAIERYLILGKKHTSDAHFKEAEATYHEALETTKGHSDTPSLRSSIESVHDALISLYQQQDDTPKAVEELLLLGQTQEEWGDIARALQTIERILELDSENEEAQKQILEFREQFNQRKEAFGEYQQQFDRYMKEKKFDRAVEIKQEQLKIRPGDASLKIDLIDAFSHLGNIDEVVKYRFDLAQDYINSERFQEALEMLEALLREKPDNGPALKMIADTYTKMGDEKKALETFRKFSHQLDTDQRWTPIPETTPSPARLHETSSREISPFPLSLQIVREYTFEAFVVGDANNFAYATCLAVAKEPARAYNPLFLYSDVGLGKTHLLHAIANHLINQEPSARIIYTSGEEFTNALIEAIQDNTVTAFRNRHKSADILLVDDVQFLAGKEKAQEEFFLIFNTLFQAKRQIAVSCDRPPKDITPLEKRLKSRFGAGIVVDIQPPDYETRVAILKKDMKSIGGDGISDEVLNAIAEKIPTNIRDLKGILNQIIAFHQMQQKPITVDLVNEKIDHLYQSV